jgi:iron complex transport system substrate-binding protein
VGDKVRVVSLACSNTEIVCALGLGHLLVGVDDHSDHPPDVVAPLPRLGPDLSIAVDRVLALRPDVVLASMTLPGHEHVVERIARAGLPHVAPDPQSLDDVYRDIRDIAGLLGVPERGDALVAEMAAALVPRDIGPRPAVLVEWWPKPVIVPGRRSWVTDVIALAGGANPWAERDCRSTPVTDDEVVAASPDVVVVSWCGVPFHRYRLDVVEKRASWRTTPALRDGRIVPISEAFLGRPGPRLVDGYHQLCAVLGEQRAASSEQRADTDPV